MIRFIKLAILWGMLSVTITADAEEWRFNVLLDGKPFGTHIFKLDIDGNKKVLKSDANFKYKILGITAYRYVHKADETWQGDCLQSLSAITNDNGVEKTVLGQQTESGFSLSAPKSASPLSNCVMTFAYWNPKTLLQSRLLNPQTGDYLDSKIKYVGEERILVKGESVQAKHHTIETVKFKIDLWYSPQDEWLALQSTTPDGHKVTYSLD